MKRLGTCAVLVTGLCISAFSQRSGARGGFSGHSASAPRAGFSASRSFTAARSSVGSRPLNVIPAYGRIGPTPYLGRPAYLGANSYRRPYIWPYRVSPYSAWPGWVSYGYPGYLDTSGYYYDSASQPGYVAPYDSQPPYEPQAPPVSAPPAPVDMSYRSAPPAEADAVTLVFKDGRPSEQIHNYLLTRTTLYVRDQHHRDIPLDEIDLAATRKANHDTGVDFQVPATK